MRFATSPIIGASDNCKTHNRNRNSWRAPRG